MLIINEDGSYYTECYKCKVVFLVRPKYPKCWVVQESQASTQKEPSMVNLCSSCERNIKCYH